MSVPVAENLFIQKEMLILSTVVHLPRRSPSIRTIGVLSGSEIFMPDSVPRRAAQKRRTSAWNASFCNKAGGFASSAQKRVRIINTACHIG